jgi:hypothetical protein
MLGSNTSRIPDADDRRFMLGSSMPRTGVSRRRGCPGDAQDRRCMLGSNDPGPEDAEDRRFTLGSNDPVPALICLSRARRRLPEDMPEDRRFTPSTGVSRSAQTIPAPLICLSRARRWRAGHVCWVRRPTQDCTGIERREARVTSVCALAREANWHGARFTECDSRQLADSAEAVHAGEAE